MTPYEEVNQLIKRMQEVKEITLEGSDAEYFDVEQLDTLITTANNIILTSLFIKESLSEE